MIELGGAQARQIALRAQLIAAGLSPVAVSETTGPFMIGHPPRPRTAE